MPAVGLASKQIFSAASFVKATDTNDTTATLIETYGRMTQLALRLSVCLRVLVRLCTDVSKYVACDRVGRCTSSH